MALFMDLVALSNGLHGSVQMDSVALFSWIGWLRHHGIFSLFLQTDYFNKEAASSNNIGYKIVHKGDIIISPQNLWMGNITYNDKFDNGLVSPSYRIYKVKEEYNAFYISRIMMSYRALSLYKNISEQGASVVRRNLNVDAFNELCFPIPNIKKQDEVGLFLSKLHQELKCETWILMQLKNQKNYLLNKMFI